jgi:thiamine biosynthesis protein ThiI
VAGTRIEAVPFFRLEQFFAGMPREAPYLLYCDKGLMSRLHAELLVEQGFTRVAVYRP